jgi:Flp pilus assembly protein TadG
MVKWALFYKFKNAAGGNVAMLFALSLPVLILLVGLGLDYVRLTVVATKLQQGADAAALHLARAVADNTAMSSADADATVGEFAGITFADTGSPYSGTATQSISARSPAVVKVTFSQPQALAFGGFIGQTTVTVSRSATGASNPAVPVCLLVLDPSADSAWSSQGTSSVNAQSCVAQVNSTSKNALSTNGSASVQTLKTLVVGPTQPSSGFSPTPLFNQAALADPFASKISWPAVSTCTYSNLTVKNTTLNLTPGTFCGGLNLSTSGTLNLAAGIYVIQTGGLSLASGSALNAPYGSTVVLLDPSATISMQSGATLNVTAPSSGSWKNFVFAQKPQGSELTSTLIGGGGSSINGVVYLPTQNLNLTGGGSLAQLNTLPRTFVVNRITTQGNGQIYLAGSSDLVVTPTNNRLVN